jgi:hypothetical protein
MYNLQIHPEKGEGGKYNQREEERGYSREYRSQSWVEIPLKEEIGYLSL